MEHTEQSLKSCLEEQIYCPITKQIMLNPVVAADGFTYERDAIERWFKTNSKSPLTNKKIKKTVNELFYLKQFISQYVENNPSKKNDMYQPEKTHNNYSREIRKLVREGNYDGLLDYTGFRIRKFGISEFEKIVKNADEKVILHLVDNLDNIKYLSKFIRYSTPDIVGQALNKHCHYTNNNDLTTALQYGSIDMVLIIDGFNENYSDIYDKHRLGPIFSSKIDICEKLEYVLPNIKCPSITFSYLADNEKMEGYQVNLSSLVSTNKIRTFCKNNSIKTIKKVYDILQKYKIKSKQIVNTLNPDMIRNFDGNYLFKKEEEEDETEETETEVEDEVGAVLDLTMYVDNDGTSSYEDSSDSHDYENDSEYDSDYDSDYDSEYDSKYDSEFDSEESPKPKKRYERSSSSDTEEEFGQIIFEPVEPVEASGCIDFGYQPVETKPVETKPVETKPAA